MNQSGSRTRLLFTSGLTILGLAQIAFFVDILRHLPVERDAAGRLKLVPESDKALSFLFGTDLLLVLLVFLVMLALVVWLESTGHMTRLQKWLLGAVAALASLLAVWIFPISSFDIFMYIAYGRQLGILGQSPYVTTLQGQLADPVFAQLPLDWVRVPSVYGPVANFVFAGLGLLSIQDPFDILLTHRVFSLLVYAGLFFLARDILKTIQVKLPATTLFAFFGNPAVIQMLLVEGHIEGLVIFFLLAAAVAQYHNRDGWVGLAIGLACCTKIIVWTIVPLFGLEIMRRRTRHGYLAMGVFCLVIAFFYIVSDGGEIRAALVAATNTGMTWFGPLGKVLKQLVLIMSGAIPSLPGDDVILLTRRISTAFLLVSLFAIYLTHWVKGSQQTVFLTAGFVLMVTAICMNWFMPWYVLWGLPLLLFSRLDSVLRFGVVVSASLLIVLNSLGKDYLTSSVLLDRLASSVFLLGVFLTFMLRLLMSRLLPREKIR